MAGVLNQWVTDRFAIYNADSLDVLASMPDDCLHGSIYSPPFMGLYVYSSHPRDVSNARTRDEFLTHYGFFVDELYRVTMPGRTTAVHAALIPTGNTGKDGLYDLPGEIIRLHERTGWVLISRHVIWKEPLAVRLRTMAKNLAHKTIIDDAAMAGMAAPDEVLVFRKPGKPALPVQHPTGLHAYAGSIQPPADLLRFRGWEGDQKANKYSQWIWRRYASSIWDDIRIDNVLPFRDARDEDDEKHVHPLQLDVIARYVQMRTMPGETIFTPFMGVGSEVYQAVREGRRGVGAELKPTYYTQAVRNLEHVDDPALAADELDLGEVIETEGELA